jgi:hypothetical protein
MNNNRKRERMSVQLSLGPRQRAEGYGLSFSRVEDDAAIEEILEAPTPATIETLDRHGVKAEYASTYASVEAKADRLTGRNVFTLEAHGSNWLTSGARSKPIRGRSIASSRSCKASQAAG